MPITLLNPVMGIAALHPSYELFEELNQNSINVIASEAKQSSFSAVCGMDCFVASAPRNDVDGLVHKAISKSRSPIDRLRNPGWLDTLLPATATLHGVVFDILVWRAPGRPFACPDRDRRWLTEP
jgi:hypothetical protein